MIESGSAGLKRTVRRMFLGIFMKLTRLATTDPIRNVAEMAARLAKKAKKPHKILQKPGEGFKRSSQSHFCC